MKIHRLRAAALRPQEIWDLPTAEGLLWERIGAREIERRFAAEGAAAVRALAAILQVEVHDRLVTAPRRLVLSGGLSELPGFSEAVAPFATTLAGGRFSSCLGAGQVLGGQPPLVADLGQTGLKLAGPSGRSFAPRPASIPLRLISSSPSPDELGRQDLQRLVDWVASEILREAGSARHLLLGMPCPVDDALRLGPSTYGFAPDSPFCQRLAEALGDRCDELAVVNDAEIAALDAHVAYPGEPLLVVTLGFGPGAAWVDAPEIAGRGSER